MHRSISWCGKYDEGQPEGLSCQLRRFGRKTYHNNTPFLLYQFIGCKFYYMLYHLMISKPYDSFSFILWINCGELSNLPEVNTINDGANILILDFYPTSLLIHPYHNCWIIYNKWEELVSGTRNMLRMLLDENMG